MAKRKKNIRKIRKSNSKRKGLKIKYKTKRKGKINPWIKGAIAAVAPSVAATGYGLVKHLLRNKYAGYSNIYS